MSLRKPFRAVPIRLGERYSAESKREARVSKLKDIAFVALVAGLSSVAFLGILSLPAASVSTVHPSAAIEALDSTYYAGCNEVRSAGKAPLYREQPGYRSDMDGDDDGIACEPHRDD